MAGLIEDDTDVEMGRYDEAYQIKTYSGLSPSNMRGASVQYDPVNKTEAVYVDLPSGGKFRIGDRPVTPMQVAETDAAAAKKEEMLAPQPGATSTSPVPTNGRAPIESIIGGANGPELADYEAAGYTEAEVMQYEKFRTEQYMAQPNIADAVKLTPDQISQYAAQPGAEIIAPQGAGVRGTIQDMVYNALDPNREPTGGAADVLRSAFSMLPGTENLDPGDLRFFSNLFTNFADVTVPGVGGAISMDEGSTMMSRGFNQLSSGSPDQMASGAVDMTIGAALTTLGVAEFVPFVKSLGEPAKDMLQRMSPEAKNLLADTIGLSRAISQRDKDMLIEIFQPRGTPQSLSAGAVDTSYRMQQQPRGPEDDLPIRLDDLTKSTTGENAGYPADFYSANGPRIYAPGPQFAGDEFGQANRESYKAIMAVRGKPDAEVTIYRAVPDDPKITTINRGDFVTLSPTYAKLHGGSGYGPKGEDAGKILSEKVKVKDIYFDGNDVNEFGYFPEEAAQGSVGKDILELNLKAQPRLAELFKSAEVTADSSTDEIASTLLRAERSGIIDRRTADEILNGMKGQ